MTQDVHTEHIALLREPWVWRKALRRANLPASALRVGLALIDEFANRESGACFPSYEALAGETGLTVRAVRDGVAALRSTGLIDTRKMRFDGSLSYFLILRTDVNPSLRAGAEVTEKRHSKGRKNVVRTDVNPSLEVTEKRHLTSEYNLPIKPSNRTVSPACGPADDAFGALRSASSGSSLRSDPAASVGLPVANGCSKVREGVAGEIEDIEVSFRADLFEVKSLLLDVTGYQRPPEEIYRPIQQVWRSTGSMSRRRARQIVNQLDKERMAS